jgi:hypothetical protein
MMTVPQRQTFRGEQEFFRATNSAGETLDVFFLWESEDEIPQGYTGKTRAQAFAAALEFAGEGTQVQLRSRERMNMYVGSPVWGNPQVLDTVFT